MTLYLERLGSWIESLEVIHAGVAKSVRLPCGGIKNERSKVGASSLTYMQFVSP